MRSFSRLFFTILLAAMAVLASQAQAAVTTFSDRASWQAAVGTPITTVDFSTKDDGTPISNPPADNLFFSTLTLNGVSFLNVYSYLNQYVYVPDQVYLRVNLPAGTTAFGVNLKPIFDTSGTYTIRLSSGEQFTAVAGVIPLSFEFFGVTSPQPLQWMEVSLNTTYLVMDNFSIIGARPVGIDIKPGSSTNPINPQSEGVTPVALLSSPTFSASSVDWQSLRFGVNGTEASLIGYSISDVNKDQLPDVVLQFRTSDTGIACGTAITQGILTGQTSTGQKFKGMDSFRLTGCPNKWAPKGKESDLAGRSASVAGNSAAAAE
jgi:hypothetical protein